MLEPRALEADSESLKQQHILLPVESLLTISSHAAQLASALPRTLLYNKQDTCQLLIQVLVPNHFLYVLNFEIQVYLP